MVYLVGVVSFILGFLAGQMVLAHLLRDRSNEELKKDRSLHMYGILNWLIAILFTVTGVGMYKVWFGP